MKLCDKWKKLINSLRVLVYYWNHDQRLLGVFLSNSKKPHAQLRGFWFQNFFKCIIDAYINEHVVLWMD